MGRFLHIEENKVVIEVAKAVRPPPATPAAAAVPSFSMERFLTPREEVLKAAGAAFRKASYAADQPSGGMPAGIAAGTPTPSVPQDVQISATGPATSTPSVPEDKVLETISVDVRNEETPDTQVFVPSAVRAANDLRKARRNAARSREFSNPFDLARDETADFIEQMEAIYAGTVSE